MDIVATAPPASWSDALDPVWSGLQALSTETRLSILCTQQRVYARHFKRPLDIVVGSLLLLVLTPLLAIAAVVVSISMGRPVLYRQLRVGRGGAPIMVVKLRSMTPDRRKTQVPFALPDRRRRHKTPTDPRVTKVGTFLRRSSIDELPQLINVIRGEMSLVGPRPELPQLVERYEDWQHARHIVRPGLTGWWQVNGRSDKPMHECTELDIYYAANMSFWLDVKIILKTAWTIGRGHGAY